MSWIKMKTCIIVAVCLLGITTVSQAQTFAEFFKQKKTQKKYLLEQIAALQVYGGYLKNGYQIASGGLKTIRDITAGEFKLHDVFISSLKQVSPVISNDARIAEIVVMQISILKAFGGIKASAFLSADDLAYIRLVRDGVIEECDRDLEELLQVISSGKLEMKDDERLQRLNKVYESMLDKSAFTQDFIGNATLLIRQRQSEQNEIKNLRRYYEIE